MEQHKQLNETQREALCICYEFLLELRDTVSEIHPKDTISSIYADDKSFFFEVTTDDDDSIFFFIRNILDKDPEEILVEAAAIRAQLDEFIANYFAGEQLRKANKIAALEAQLAKLKEA